ncbi:MAG: hypothetical protein HYV63_07950 [Candidatus Schekmanbacteria bacterium]|nr:hypothetical protein [Candidatus Schekmanbacteria bacterium]
MRQTVIDGFDFAAIPDFREFSRQHLRGVGPLGTLPRDEAPIERLLDAYERLGGTPLVARLAEGIAACLNDPDPAIRWQVLIFFEKNPMAAGGERIVEAASGDRSGFRGVPDPRGGDLEWKLLSAVGRRAGGGDVRALALAREEAIHPGQPTPLIAALTRADPDWVAAHAEEIARATPSTAAVILNNLQGSRHDVGALGERLAPVGARDPKFRGFIELFIDDPAAKARILRALPARP